MKFTKKLTAFLTLIALLFSIMAFTPYGSLASEASAENRPMLLPGGYPFGIKLFTKGVIVVNVTDIETSSGLKSPAKESGIEENDIITAVNGKEITTAEELGNAVNSGKGEEISLSVTRNSKEITIHLKPERCITDGLYKAGIWVRDSTAGIGTITYVEAKTNQFGGLGHGVCDSDGNVLPLLRGVVTPVEITSVIKGLKNEPGELRGNFIDNKWGVIRKNTACGVFGKLDDISVFKSEAMEICYKSELKTGKAYVLTTIEGDTPRMYEIEIIKIYKNSGKTKNFLIEVTDEYLLEKAGGIVQGMSGSPIIQNGRIAGAVTHVMINDPTRGYGIFIENMLESQ